MAEADVISSHVVPNPPSSPPPNCAICLGACTNKCFSDSCMHQFCFKCLLEWSKIKAVCPLCKQPFTTIIHNVKSNDEYDEHIIEQVETVESPNYMEENDYYFLPAPPAPPGPPMTRPQVRNIQQVMRHFQFRTSFTVDPRGELVVQQMLLTHPLRNYGFNHNTHRRYRHRDISSTTFRRSIYDLSLWVDSPPDITGRYRETNPEFYRLNPAAINRLAPWLNRELNALLQENTQQVMTLVDVILTHLREHHIRGRFFQNLLREHFGTKTTHFIHEFYEFMKSPFDMVGYDRHVVYTRRLQDVEIVTDIDNSSDSDVQVIESESTQSRPAEVIEINSDTDSDVILVDNEGGVTDARNLDSDARSSSVTEEEIRTPILPLKIRLKRKRQSREGSSKTRRKHKREAPASSSGSSNVPDSDTTVYSNSSLKRIKRKHKSKRSKHHKSAKEPKPEVNNAAEPSSSDDETLMSLQKKLRCTESLSSSLKCKDKKRKHKRDRNEKKLCSTRVESPTSDGRPTRDSTPELNTYYNPSFSSSNCNNSPRSFDESNSRFVEQDNSQQSSYASEQNDSQVKIEVANEDYYPGPSNSSERYHSAIVKKENVGNTWYSRPYIYSSDSDDE